MVAGVVLATLGGVSGAAAQLGIIEGLFKNLSRVGGYWDYGGFLPGSSTMTAGKPTAPPQQIGLQGPGLEFSFDIGTAGRDPGARDTAPAWAFELGLGYSQLFGFRSRDPSFDLRGSIRELPRISWYAVHHPERVLSPYFGVHMGFVQLQSAAIYDSSGAHYPIAGSTWELGASAGAAVNVTTGTTGFTLFVEPGYSLRNITNLDWGGQNSRIIPARFPRSLRFSGWMIAAGVEFNVPRR
jgi:hypothetical protein